MPGEYRWGCILSQDTSLCKTPGTRRVLHSVQYPGQGQFLLCSHIIWVCQHFSVTDLVVGGVEITFTSPPFVRNKDTEMEVYFNYSHMYGAGIMEGNNSHQISILATNVDLSLDITQPVLDILHQENNPDPIAVNETTDKTLTVR